MKPNKMQPNVVLTSTEVLPEIIELNDDTTETTEPMDIDYPEEDEWGWGDDLNENDWMDLELWAEEGQQPPTRLSYQ